MKQMASTKEETKSGRQAASAAPFGAIRSSFAGAAAGPYMDVSARSLLYSGARKALDGYLDANAMGRLNKSEMFAAVENTRSLFARLLGANADEIAYTRNVTDGIATFAASLPWQKGDNVVLCEALEHPANLLPWYGLRPRFGIEVKVVPPAQGRIPFEGIQAAIDGRTRAVALSSVTFAPGFRSPVAAVGAECRRRGVLLVVDGAQSIGSLDTDVAALNIDALAASTQKALMGLYGLGFLYVRRAVAETLDPVFVSRFGVATEGHEASVGNPAEYKLAKGARRFDVGNFNFPAAIAVGRSLELLHELGMKNVEAHVCGLARKLAIGFLETGLPVFGGEPGPDSSHIVTVGRSLGFEHDSAGDERMRDLYAYLAANNVRLSIRRDLLRFSLHVYNNADDVAQVVDLVRRWNRR
jgi:cysteine desulfurase / selenocysteine lyase